MANATHNTLPIGHKDLTRRAVLCGLPLAFPKIARMLPSIYADVTAAEPPIHPILALPFVRDRRNDERASGAAPRCFWHVSPSGNYHSDCMSGAYFATLAVEYMTATRSPHVLAWIISDMMALQRRHSGIEVGFASVIGRLVTDAHASRLPLHDRGMA